MNKKLTLTTGTEKMIFGVCGGLAKYFEIDPTIVRVGVALITFLGIGSPVLIYIIMALIIPKESKILP
jgi:phage shock protein C